MGSGSDLLFILGGTIIILLVVFIILSVNIRKRAKAERAAVAVSQKLKESYIELQRAYDEVTTTKNVLYSKYEELLQSKEQMRQIAYSDYLTGLPNRVAFVEQVNSSLLTMKEDEIFGLFDIDVDNFKDINDTLGHSYGDKLLVEVMERLQDVVGQEEYLARIGGDEFAVLVSHAKSEEEIKQIALDVMDQFAVPFEIAERTLFLTLSMGITYIPKDGNTTQDLLMNMNSAMYEAKGAGKNMLCFFDDSMNVRLKQKLEMQSELRNAIKEDQFVVYYQAQIDLDLNKIVGFEALIRWMHPTKGIVPPVSFIPLAEENGMIIDIGTKVLYEACRQLKQWHDAGYDTLIMAVNISAKQLRDKGFINLVYQVIEETKVNPNYLEFEITESTALENLDFTVEMITKLKKIGITFSLDDFGTGYSSLSYLKRLPVNNLKIDKSFLDTILENISDQQIVSTVISLARNLNIAVIAEGVEQSEQESMMKEMNCDKAQGYYYSKPVPKGEAFAVLEKMNQHKG